MTNFAAKPFVIVICNILGDIFVESLMISSFLPLCLKTQWVLKCSRPVEGSLNVFSRTLKPAWLLVHGKTGFSCFSIEVLMLCDGGGAMLQFSQKEALENHASVRMSVKPRTAFGLDIKLLTNIQSCDDRTADAVEVVTFVSTKISNGGVSFCHPDVSVLIYGNITKEVEHIDSCYLRSEFSSPLVHSARC